MLSFLVDTEEYQLCAKPKCIVVYARNYAQYTTRTVMREVQAATIESQVSSKDID